jgi:hypothetical protein
MAQSLNRDLVEAAKSGDASRLEQALRQGADVNSSGEEGVSLFAVNEPGLCGVMEPVFSVKHGHRGVVQA